MITFGENNERLLNLSVSLPFNIPTSSSVNDTIKLSVTFNNSNQRVFRFKNMIIQNESIEVNLSNVDLAPGQVSIKYSLSFFEETSEESQERNITSKYIVLYML